MQKVRTAYPTVNCKSQKLDRSEYNSQKIKYPSNQCALVPNLQIGNAVLGAPASRLAKLELRLLGSQAGAWEPAQKFTTNGLTSDCVPA